MAIIGLSAYKFTIHNKKENNLYDLHNVKGGKDIIDNLKEKFDRTSDLEKLVEKKKAVEVLSCESYTENKKGRPYYKYLFLEINSGDYGIISVLKDIETQQISYKRKTTDAEYVPLYAMIAVPVGESVDKGIILLESISKFGIKTVLEHKLRKYCSAIDDDAMLNINTVSTIQEIDLLIQNSTLKNIRVTKYYDNNDTSSKNKITKEERIYYGPVIDNNTLKYIFKSKNYSNLGVAQIDGFDADDFKACFDVGGRKKTLRVKTFDEASIVQDITENVDYDGYLPTKESLVRVMKERAEELFELQ